MFAPVYLDHNATTPMLPEVLEAMLPFLRGQFGNPSSRHEYGRVAREAVDRARSQVADAVGAQASEVIFTSGGTEANNFFIKGGSAGRPGLVRVSAIEHPCVSKPALQLAGGMAEIKVDGMGRVLPEALDGAALVSVMLANNETGGLQDIDSIAGYARSVGALMHSDAVQAFGKRALDFRALNRCGVNAISLSAHKIGGPKGCGALVLDKKVDLVPLLAGGGHERGLRSGTENVAAIVGFGAACALLPVQLAKNQAQRRRRDQMESQLAEMGAVFFGQGAERLPNTSYFAFAGIEGETLVSKLDRAGYAIASGAACSSGNPGPSHVLSAMGVEATLARCAVRVSLGPETSDQEIEGFLMALRTTLNELRGLASIAKAA